jgi:hypothetical protein
MCYFLLIFAPSQDLRCSVVFFAPRTLQLQGAFPAGLQVKQNRTNPSDEQVPDFALCPKGETKKRATFFTLCHAVDGETVGCRYTETPWNCLLLKCGFFRGWQVPWLLQILNCSILQGCFGLPVVTDSVLLQRSEGPKLPSPPL